MKLNSEFNKLIQKADAEGNKLLNQVKQTGDTSLLPENLDPTHPQNKQDEVENLFWSALDLIGSSEEDRVFVESYAGFVMDRCILLTILCLNKEEETLLKKAIGNRSTVYASEIAPLYSEPIEFVDDAIEENDRNKQAYVKLRADLISRYHDAFEKRWGVKVVDQGTGGCYVATCVYGSYDCPEVWTLRRFRDHTLSKTWFGRCFISVYYAVSPKLVKIFGNAAWFKKVFKFILDKLVINLNIGGVGNTPYHDEPY